MQKSRKSIRNVKHDTNSQYIHTDYKTIRIDNIDIVQCNTTYSNKNYTIYYTKSKGCNKYISSLLQARKTNLHLHQYSNVRREVLRGSLSPHQAYLLNRLVITFILLFYLKFFFKLSAYTHVSVRSVVSLYTLIF